MTGLDSLLAHRVVPVLVIKDAGQAKAVGTALVEGGLPIVEVTLRTPESWRALEILTAMPGLTAGVGSVQDAASLRQAVDAGATFAVSPGLLESVAVAAQQLGIPYVPGVSTPSEMMRARELGFDTLKWFPAESMGGPSALKAMSAPFPNLRFVPTGGINAANAATYLALPSVAGVGGSWMVPDALVASGDVDGMRHLAAEAVAAVGSRQS